MKLLSLLFCILLLSACSSLSDKAKKLRVTTLKSDVASCVQVGVVHSSSGMSPYGEMVMVGNHNSGVKIRNLAAEYGDTLLLVKDVENMFGSEREGIIFRCPSSQTFTSHKPASE